MTIEEAIKVLSYIADEMPSMECADWKEAISMAIEALKQESTYTSEIAQKAYEDGKKDRYIIETITIQKKKYNPNYGDNRRCVCGHTYYRHFDPWDDMEAVGCKYCGCEEFIEAEREELE